MARLPGVWEEWGSDVGDPRADYGGVDGVRLYVNLHDQGDLADKVAWCRGKGLKVIFCLDYHVQAPYHGRPPHVNERGEIVRTPEGYGYAPFGWGEGWLWAESLVMDLLSEYDPEGVQWGEDPHVRNGWGFSTKPEYHYNDEFTIFHRAAVNAGWRGFVLIPDTPGSPVQRRGLLRARKTMEVEGQVLIGFDDVYRESDVDWVDVPLDEGPGEPDEEWEDPGGSNRVRLARIEAQNVRILSILEDVADFLDIET